LLGFGPAAGRAGPGDAAGCFFEAGVATRAPEGDDPAPAPLDAVGLPPKRAAAPIVAREIARLA
jgi:hypothetical protein